MEFHILGPVELRVDGQVTALGGAKPRTLLATMLVHHDQVIAADRLIEALWGASPPSRARSILQTYVSSLRRTISGSGGATVAAVPPGYSLRLMSSTLDRNVFEQLLSSAKQATSRGRHEIAADILSRALAQWHGPALGGVESSLLDSEAARLEELRLTALEDRVNANIALGRLAEVAAELTDLVRKHPFRERLHGQLMTVLCGLGRQSEALLVYRDARQSLVEELGVEPGPELRALHTQILRGGSGGLTMPSADRLNTLSQRSSHDEQLEGRPAQLPAVPADFTGRAGEAKELVANLTAAANNGRVPVQLIVGGAGMGKSALAAHVAHQIIDEYPDGQLYADLRGLDGTPAESHEILGSFLRALSPGNPTLPESTVERAARYRTLLAERRMLVVLDDARDERQIRPLLPGTETCGVLVTARRRLAGLAGCQVLELEGLPDTDGRLLFASLAGLDRTSAEPEATRQVVQLCGGLPLALRLAGARLASRRLWTVRLLADRLADESLRLDELSAGDHDMRDSIRRSYNQLDFRQRAALGICGLLGPRDISPWILCTALAISPIKAERVMEGLVDAYLMDVVRVDEVGQAHYAVHDLVRLYARERAPADGLIAKAAGDRLDAWLLPRQAVLDGAAPISQQPGVDLPANSLYASIREAG
uniref:Transcriptional regulator, SARP family n=1 Tax=Salinispora arenicola (strain CNS-205) TaxID=391037 RepID=A8M887_SALAI